MKLTKNEILEVIQNALYDYAGYFNDNEPEMKSIQWAIHETENGNIPTCEDALNEYASLQYSNYQQTDSLNDKGIYLKREAMAESILGYAEYASRLNQFAKIYSKKAYYTED